MRVIVPNAVRVTGAGEGAAWGACVCGVGRGAGDAAANDALVTKCANG